MALGELVKSKGVQAERNLILSQKPEKTEDSPKAAKPRRATRVQARRSDDYQTGQVLWTFVVAMAVAVAALQHVFSEKPSQFTDAVAARSPGSQAFLAPERQ